MNKNEELNNSARLRQARKQSATPSGSAPKHEKTVRVSSGRRRALARIYGRENIKTQPSVDPLADTPYFLAFGAAFLKDILDLIGIGSLPLIGTVVTLCFSIFIGFMILMAGANGKRKAVRRIMKRLGVLAAGTIVEAFFVGLNFFPIETFTVIIIYFLVVAERKNLVRIPIKA